MKARQKRLKTFRVHFEVEGLGWRDVRAESIEDAKAQVEEDFTCDGEDIGNAIMRVSEVVKIVTKRSA